MASIGLSHLLVAPLATAVEGSTPTYGTGGMEIGEMVSANLTWTRDNQKLYGNNHMVHSTNGITGGEITVGTTYITEAGKKLVLGLREFNTPTGSETQEYDMTNEDAPFVGVGLINKVLQGSTIKWRAIWIWKCQFGMDEDMATKGESTEYKTPELKGTILSVIPKSDLTPDFYKEAEFTTEAAALSWAKTIGSIT